MCIGNFGDVGVDLDESACKLNAPLTSVTLGTSG